MALVVLCGQPCSGKSTVGAKLAAALRAMGLEVAVVDEPSLHQLRNDSYKDTVSEKHTRGKLKSAVERSLSKARVVILDSLNNIKGYRYELWCIARSAGNKYCMVHVDCPLEQCRGWNRQRQGDSYSDAVFDDLSGRFERPDARNRWDAPLFTVHPEVVAAPDPGSVAPAPESHAANGSDAAPAESAAGDEAAAAGATSRLQGEPCASSKGEGRGTDGVPDAAAEPSEPGRPTGPEAALGGALGEEEGGYQAGDGPPPMDELLLEGPQGEQQALQAIVSYVSGRPSGKAGGDGEATPSACGSDGAAGTMQQQQQRGQGQGMGQANLQPSFATSATPMLGTNTLHEIDQAAQGVVTAISDAQAAAAGGAAGIVRFGAGLQALRMEQPVTLAELRRHKRAFLKLATKIMFARLHDSATAQRMFIDYLKDNVAGASIAPR